MKKNLLYSLTLLVALVSIISCSSVSDGKLIIEDGSYYSSYEVYENKKRDTLNLFKVSGDFGKNHIENAGFATTIRMIEDSYKEKEIVFNDVEDTVSLDILCEDNLGKDKRKELVNSVLDYYNLMLEITSKTESYWELFVKDRDKLDKFKCSAGTKTRQSYHKDGKIIIECLDLKTLVSHFNRKENLVLRGKEIGIYNLEFIDDSLSENKELLDKYGLAIKSIQQEVGVYTISKK